MNLKFRLLTVGVVATALTALAGCSTAENSSQARVRRERFSDTTGCRRCFVQPTHQFVGDTRPPTTCHLGHLPARQTGQRDRHRCAGTLDPPLPVGVLPRRRRPRADRHQQPIPGGASQQPEQRINRLRVSPLQVVGDQQYRSGGGQRIEAVTQSLGSHPGRGLPTVEHSTRFDSPLGQQRIRCAIVLHAVGRQDPKISCLRDQVRQEAGLAESGLALDHQNRRHAALGAIEHRGEQARIDAVPFQHSEPLASIAWCARRAYRTTRTYSRINSPSHLTT